MPPGLPLLDHGPFGAMLQIIFPIFSSIKRVTCLQIRHTYLATILMGFLRLEVGLRLELGFLGLRKSTLE